MKKKEIKKKIIYEKNYETDTKKKKDKNYQLK